MRLRPFILIPLVAFLAACSVLLPPTVTPSPTPTPKFGIEELRNVFQNLPEGYVEVDPQSRELGSASFNDAFDLQLAFWDSKEKSGGFSISLGILPLGDQEEFDYALEKQWGTADADVIHTENIGRAIGLFRPNIGDIALGNRFLELPVRSETELREAIVFRRGQVAVVVKFAQHVWSTRNPLASGIIGPDHFLFERWAREQSCGNAYICHDKQPNLVTGPDAARMIDEAIVRFYEGITATGDG